MRYAQLEVGDSYISSFSYALALIKVGAQGGCLSRFTIFLGIGLGFTFDLGFLSGLATLASGLTSFIDEGYYYRRLKDML